MKNDFVGPIELVFSAENSDEIGHVTRQCLISRCSIRPTGLLCFMSNYRRILEAGAQYFFTVNLQDRRQDLLVRHADTFLNIYKDISERHPFETLAICILPDHIHCIWQLPEGDSDYPKRWRLIKSAFTRELKKKGHTDKIWQNRYWEHHLRDDNDVNNHIDYIHGNPIKHGYVEALKDWPHSSWHKYERSINEELAVNRSKWDKSKWGER